MPVANIYGGFPASGEIDMMESSGNQLYHCGKQSRGDKHNRMTCHCHTFFPFSGVDTVQSNLHMGISGGGPHWSNASLKTNTSTDFAKEFHIFELNWTEEFLAFSIDGEEIYRQASQTGTKEYRRIFTDDII